MQFAADALLRHRRAQQRRQFRRLAAPDVGENLPTIDADAGKRAAPRAAVRRGVGADFASPQREVALRMMRRIRHQHQVCKIVGAQHLGRLRRIPIAPDVAVDHQEGLVVPEQGQRVGDAAGGFQCALRFGRIGDRQAPARAVTQRRFDLQTEMRVVDHHLAQAGPRQALQMPDDQRFAAHRQEGLGREIGQRPHALAAPGSQNHCLHGALAA